MHKIQGQGLGAYGASSRLIAQSNPQTRLRSGALRRVRLPRWNPPKADKSPREGRRAAFSWAGKVQGLNKGLE
jgi:hypothetical protein